MERLLDRGLVLIGTKGFVTAKGIRIGAEIAARGDHDDLGNMGRRSRNGNGN